jgi:hypothetical protein
MACNETAGAAQITAIGAVMLPSAKTATRW